jgi:hypothetical protein
MDHILSNDTLKAVRMSALGEIKKTKEEAVAIYFKVQSWHLLERTEENHDKPVRKFWGCGWHSIQVRDTSRLLEPV